MRCNNYLSDSSHSYTIDFSNQPADVIITVKIVNENVEWAWQCSEIRLITAVKMGVANSGMRSAGVVRAHCWPFPITLMADKSFGPLKKIRRLLDAVQCSFFDFILL